MIDVPSVAAVVTAFDDPADGEGLKSRDLVLMLLHCSPAPFSREQFTPGHITCTGLVVSAEGGRLLLVHHRRLDRWLLPGGHVEEDDAFISDAARREVVEETGAVLCPEARPRLAGIDVHGIPAKGHEPYHLHHDLIFAFRAQAEAIRVSPESREVLWCAPADFGRYAVPDNARRCWGRVVG